MLKHLTAPRLATLQAFFKTNSGKDILDQSGGPTILARQTQAECPLQG